MPRLVDPTALNESLAADAPCGPDLDLEGDLDFANGIARVEGLLPASFFTRDEEGKAQPFDRSTIDFDKEHRALAALVERSRDLRVLALMARLSILDRDLAGFASTLQAVALLLQDRWEAVHPQGDGGDFGFRAAVLQSLDDMPTVMLPLQHVVLAQSRRHGAITFRAVMTADGEVPAREGETSLDRGDIERAMADAEPDALSARLGEITRVCEAVEAIRSATLAKAGHEGVVDLERIRVLAARIRGFVEAAAGGGDVAGTPPPGPDASDEEATVAGEVAPRTVGPRPALATIAEASAALAAAGRYLRRCEPSSPAEVLVRQAQGLIGKPFVEVMRILVPSRAAETTITLGGGRGLKLSFEQLADLPDPGIDAAVEDVTPDEAEEGGASEEGPSIASRGDAVARIRDAAAFFRQREPSSPIPLLLDRAIGLVDRDFLSILKDVLPEAD